MPHAGVASETFASLHEKLAQYFIKALDDPESPVGLIKEAREFLKDNSIEGIKSPKSALGAIAERLSKARADEGEDSVPLKVGSL